MRPTLDLVVLMVTGTVCGILIAGTVAILVVEAIDPSADTSGAIRSLAAVLEVLVAAMVGYLAGRRSRE